MDSKRVIKDCAPLTATTPCHTKKANLPPSHACSSTKLQCASRLRGIESIPSFFQVGSLLLGIVEILQVQVEGCLSVKALIVDRRLELATNLDADVLDSA